MADFMTDLMELCFAPFGWMDNLVIMIPFACLFLCLAFALTKRLMRCFLCR